MTVHRALGRRSPASPPGRPGTPHLGLLHMLLDALRVPLDAHVAAPQRAGPALLVARAPGLGAARAAAAVLLALRVRVLAVDEAHQPEVHRAAEAAGGPKVKKITQNDIVQDLQGRLQVLRDHF
ncbi:hypothetical protein A6R68_12056 [Neotoma lepida]|uniref:Uncharacterized protein n=1 Tax=Neotoma lepida TaxID=56216 RepID=A0A1A6H4Y9_NEOLE|nr:hypothetical protein A6R68_12056 [Neotoma lepida]